MHRFRLQRVLEMKEKHEKEVAIRLASARTGEREAHAARAAMEGAREAGLRSAHAAQASRPSVGELRNLRLVVERLNVAVEEADGQVEDAARQVRACMDEFTAAFKERRVLDRLRDRDRESWRLGEAQADQQSMDDVALTGFLHRARP